MAANRKFTAQEAYDLFEKANAAGFEATKACKPAMYKVTNDQGQDLGYDPFPLCGFAWVIVKPANCSFCNHVKKLSGKGQRFDGFRKDDYYGGMNWWVSEFGQCHEQKVAYAHAFAKTLNESGVHACAMDRLD